jgi:hypothetical protein
MNSENGYSDYAMSIRFILNDSSAESNDGYLIEIEKNPANPCTFLWIIRNTFSSYSQVIEFYSQDLLIERFHRVLSLLSVSEPIYKACLIYIPGHPLMRLSINSLLHHREYIETSMRDVMNRWYRVVATNILSKELQPDNTEAIVSSLTRHIGEVYEEVYNNDEITELECKEDETDDEMPPLIPFYSSSGTSSASSSSSTCSDDSMPNLEPEEGGGGGGGEGQGEVETPTERILIEDSMGYFMPASHMYKSHKIDLENDKNLVAENVFENAVLHEIRSELDQELKRSESDKNVKIESGYKNYYIPSKNSLWSAFLPSRYDVTSFMRESVQIPSPVAKPAVPTFQIDPSYDQGC